MINNDSHLCKFIWLLWNLYFLPNLSEKWIDQDISMSRKESHGIELKGKYTHIYITWENIWVGVKKCREVMSLGGDVKAVKE